MICRSNFEFTIEKGRSSTLKICLFEFFFKLTALVMSSRRPMYREWRFRRKRVKVVDPRKLDLRQKQIILLSRIAILLLKGYFGREKINFHGKNLKYRKIILLINFISAPTFFLIAFYQILKNYAILINYKSLFQEKDFLQLSHSQFSEMNKLLSNSAI